MKDSNKPTTNPTKVTTLKEGAVSEYTACRECGKKFYQRIPMPVSELSPVAITMAVPNKPASKYILLKPK